MKRICHIYNYPSHYRLKIYKLLDNRFNCTFLFGDEELNIKRFDLSELKDARYTHVIHLKHYILQPTILHFLFKEYEDYVLSAATNNLSHWAFMILAQFFRKKKVYIWTHGIYGYENKLQLAIRKAYFNLSDGVFLYGNYARNNMIALGYNPNKLFLIHNSLDYDKLLKIRDTLHGSDFYEHHFGNGNSVLIFIGRLTKIKQLDMLLDAVALLKEQNELYNIVFVGDGEEKENLVSKATLLGIKQNVWFYGACYDEDENAKLIFNADLCVSPGNVGLTSIHSLMFGTPVITHNDFVWQMPEYEVIQEGVTGCFFERGNEKDLAKEISNWFAKNINNREQVRKACFNVIDSEWNPYYQMSIFEKAFHINE